MLRGRADAPALVPPADPVGRTPLIDAGDAVLLVRHALRSRANTGTSANELQDILHARDEAMCSRCSHRGLVFASCATNSFYARRVYELASSVAEYAHAPCLCVATPRISLPSPKPRTVEQVVFDSSRFPIGPKYCNRLAGWRLHSLLNPRLIAFLLMRSHDVFSVDADWLMIRPIAVIPRSDVFALRDSAAGNYLNVGLMYIRHSDIARKLWYRIANRSHLAWDQSVANEEIAASGASCCSWNSGLTAAFHNTHIHKWHRVSAAACNVTAPVRVLPPPNARSYPGWRNDTFNFDNLRRRTTRCARECATA